MNILFSPALENFVKETLQTGLYNNENEVVSEALDILKKVYTIVRKSKVHYAFRLKN